jgi:hypothetical protein
VYNLHNIVDKHFYISIVLVRSRGGSLVKYNLGFKLLYYSGWRLRRGTKGWFTVSVTIKR